MAAVRPAHAPAPATTAFDTQGYLRRPRPAVDSAPATSRRVRRFLNLASGALREKARFVGERRQPALHDVRAEVVEQQKPGEQEEGDDQQRRNEADEDVGQDQLAANAPQQPAFARRTRRTTKYPAPTASATPAAVSMTPTTPGAAAASRTAATSSAATPRTIARPGSVRNRACRTAVRAVSPPVSTPSTTSKAMIVLALRPCRGFAILTDVSYRDREAP